MNSPTADTPALLARNAGRVFYGWVCVCVAALAMVATLPGRTLGLGAVTEPLIRDFNLTPASFGTINLIATLVGAAFAVGVGQLIDRYGARLVCVIVAAALGITVILSAHVHGYAGLLLVTTLTRGFGQSALSVVSIAVVGKWFVRRVGIAMGLYTILLSIGFMAAVPALEYAVHRFGWRQAWGGLGWIILVGFAPLAGVLLRSTPESTGQTPDGDASLKCISVADELPDARDSDLSLRQAMLTNTFWALASCGFLFALFFNGFVLFRESILKELGFDNAVAMSAIVALTFAGLVANGVAGWASQRLGMGRVAGASMILMGLAAALMPTMRTPAQAIGCAALIGFAGGGVTVVFFASWSHAFGRRHVGRIQGVAQVLTVIGSAVGPLALATAQAHFGSYGPTFYAAAPILAGSGIWAWTLPMRLP